MKRVRFAKVQNGMQLCFLRTHLDDYQKQSLLQSFFATCPQQQHLTLLLYPWPVTEKIQYMLCLLAHKSLLGHTLEYISDLLTPVAEFPCRSTLHATDMSTNRRQSFFCRCTTSVEQAADRTKTAALDGLVS